MPTINDETLQERYEREALVDERIEARYMHIVGGYERDEVYRFAHLLAVLVDWLECGLDDCLGKLFMSLELGDSIKGQFFTPFEISQLMAGLTFGGAREVIELRGFVTVSEPACGAGGGAGRRGGSERRRGMTTTEERNAAIDAAMKDES